MDYEEIKKAESERALVWLANNWTRPQHCPICGNDKWQASEVVELRSFNGGNLVLGGPQGRITPVFPVMCDRCGFSYMFNALHAGVVRMSDYETVDPTEES